MGARAEKVALSLDRELLRRAEKLRKATGESRSALLARALRLLVGAESHAERVREYVAAYERAPEDARDIEAARDLAKRALAALPWDAQ